MQDAQQSPDPAARPRPVQRADGDVEDRVSAGAGQLMRTALFLTGDRHLAEDLLQDVLERTYLHWRRLGRRPRDVTLDALWPDRSTDAHGHDTTARYADQDEVVAALRRLSSRQRAVLVLR